MRSTDRFFLIVPGVLVTLALGACAAQTAVPPASPPVAALPTSSPLEPAPSPTTPATPTRPLATPSAPPPRMTPTGAPAETGVPGEPTPVAASTFAVTRTQGVLPAGSVWIAEAGRVTAVEPRASINLAEAGGEVSPFAMEAAPGGTHLAYVEIGGDQTRLVVLDTRSGERRTVVEGANTPVLGPSFSPDGRSLAYTVVEQSTARQGWQLVVADLAGGATRVLQKGEAGSGGLRPLRVVRWTPRGLIAEPLIWASDAPPQGISLVDATSGDVTALREQNHLRLAVSPDGRKVAIVEGTLPMGPDVRPEQSVTIFDVSTREEQIVLPKTNGSVNILDWSPDGSRLAHALSPALGGRVSSIRVIGATGAGEKVLQVGESGPPGSLQDVRWQDGGALLLLGATAEQLSLYELPAEDLDQARLRDVVDLERTGPEQAQARILYVPR